jgi:gamma-glutamyltranspeptidase/glutathione hydrolase
MPPTAASSGASSWSPPCAWRSRALLADWYSGLVTASTARALSLDADAAAMFLEDGCWPILGAWTGSGERHLDQRALAASLQLLAEQGPQAMYGGELGRARCATCAPRAAA